MDKSVVEQKTKIAYENMSVELDRFIDNTIEYAKREKGFILGETEIPKMATDYKDRHVLVVVRGQDYKEDLATIRSYIEEMKPILVGVDGGADALIECGYDPDVIVGDMDSVTDEALKKAKEIVVHAYVDGRAPGLKRVQDLGLDAVVFPAPGTSEDIAMLTAYEGAVEIIDQSEYTGVYEILCNKCRDRVKQHLGDDDIEVGVYMFRMDKSYLAKSDNADSIVEVFR